MVERLIFKNNIKNKKQPKIIKSNFRLKMEKYFGKTAGDIIFNSLNYLIFALLLFICFYPFYHVLKTSLVAKKLVDGVPRQVLSFESYIQILNNEGLLKSFILSIGVVLVYVLLHVFFTVLSAYPLTKKNLKGRKIILLVLVFSMLFSGGLIPFYILIRDIGLRGNILVYIIPGLISPFNIIIVRNFIQSIPEEIFESAKIDGASEMRILFNIVFPLSGPIIATIALWAGVGKWNDWMTGVLYMANDKDLWMIQQFLRNILITASSGQGVVDPEIMKIADGVKMAAIVISIVPIILIYPFVQKFFVKGVLLGSVKG